MVWIILRLSVADGASVFFAGGNGARDVSVGHLRVAALHDCLAAAKALFEPNAAQAEIGALYFNACGFGCLAHRCRNRARHVADRDDVAVPEAAALGIAGAQNPRREAWVVA